MLVQKLMHKSLPVEIKKYLRSKFSFCNEKFNNPAFKRYSF